MELITGPSNHQMMLFSYLVFFFIELFIKGEINNNDYWQKNLKYFSVSRAPFELISLSIICFINSLAV